MSLHLNSKSYDEKGERSRGGAILLPLTVHANSYIGDDLSRMYQWNTVKHLLKNITRTECDFSDDELFILSRSRSAHKIGLL